MATIQNELQKLMTPSEFLAFEKLLSSIVVRAFSLNGLDAEKDLKLFTLKESKKNRFYTPLVNYFKN